MKELQRLQELPALTMLVRRLGVCLPSVLAKVGISPYSQGKMGHLMRALGRSSLWLKDGEMHYGM